MLMCGRSSRRSRNGILLRGKAGSARKESGSSTPPPRRRKRAPQESVCIASSDITRNMERDRKEKIDTGKINHQKQKDVEQHGSRNQTLAFTATKSPPSSSACRTRIIAYCKASPSHMRPNVDQKRPPAFTAHKSSARRPVRSRKSHHPRYL